MNCEDIAWVLDERGIAALSPFEMADFKAHIAGCTDCAGQCLASERLLSFRAEVPPLPDSLIEPARQLHELRAATARERRSRRPFIIGSLWSLGAVATMFAGVPWSDTSTAKREGAPAT